MFCSSCHNVIAGARTREKRKRKEKRDMFCSSSEQDRPSSARCGKSGALLVVLVFVLFVLPWPRRSGTDAWNGIALDAARQVRQVVRQHCEVQRRTQRHRTPCRSVGTGQHTIGKVGGAVAKIAVRAPDPEADLGKREHSAVRSRQGHDHLEHKCDLSLGSESKSSS
eukprot:3045252-Amphidinium_carterae.1